MSLPTQRPPVDLSLPGAVDALLDFHRRTFGGWSMTETPPEPAPKPDPAPAPPAPPAKPDPAPAKSEPEAKFSQADLDRIIGERIAAEQKKFDERLAAETAKAGKSDLEKAQLEKTQAEERETATKKASADRVAKTEAKVAAITAGANPDRLAAVVGMADLGSAIGDDGTVDEAKIKTAVEKVLADFPEWKNQTLPGKSGGELKDANGKTKPTFTRQQIRDMSPAERAEKVEELNAAAAEGRITG